MADAGTAGPVLAGVTTAVVGVAVATVLVGAALNEVSLSGPDPLGVMSTHP